MEEKLSFAVAQLSWAPGMLLQEPRGHRDLYGAILTEACLPVADFGIVFMSNSGFEPMCGHGLIGAVTSMIETGLLAAREPFTCLLADTALGPIKIEATVESGRVTRVAFDNAPSFALQLDAAICLDDGTNLIVDVAFGGNFFVILQSSQIGLELSLENTADLSQLGMRILRAANEQISVTHPLIPLLDKITDLRFLSGPPGSCTESRNLVILGDHMIDRSPCGTGTCAELAVQYARGRIQVGEIFCSEGLLGGRFRATVVREAGWPAGMTPYPAIVPRLEGRAFLTGVHHLIYPEDDLYRDGFLLPP
jgi:proline racemase